MPATKAIKTRIKSTKSTQKMTKAMEMIASINMKRAVNQMTAMRPFAAQSWEILTRLSSFTDFKSTLFEERELGTLLIVLVTGNRGLCGNFYTQLEKKLRSYMQLKRTESKEVQFKFIVIGKKGEKIVRRVGGELLASFVELSDKPNFNEITPIYDLMMELYRNKKVDRVTILFTDYINTLKQITVTKRLMPITKDSWENFIQQTLGQMEFEQLKERHQDINMKTKYLIEPNQTLVIEAVFGMLLRAQIFNALAESKSSIEAARMTAMKNASDNAGEMVAGLNLIYNRLRQGKITQEIAEISAGKTALET